MAEKIQSSTWHRRNVSSKTSREIQRNIAEYVNKRQGININPKNTQRDIGETWARYHKRFEKIQRNIGEYVNAEHSSSGRKGS